jgi:signal transduction histidine kinase/CheY-like chemotaxis protein/HPt (histidine-containing phosphotransfer) domain-containing protein
VKNETAFDNIAKVPTLIITVVYAVVKVLFYVVVRPAQTFSRVGLGLVMIAVMALLTNDRLKLTRPQMSVLVPFSLAALELTYVALLGGDRTTYIFLIGCSLVCLMYADVWGLFIFTSLTGVTMTFLILGLGVHILPQPSDFRDEVSNYVGMIVIYALVFLLGQYTISAMNRFRLSGQTFDTALKTSPNLVVIVDDKARVEYISKSFVDLFGIEKQEYAIKLPFIDLFPTVELKLFFGELLHRKGEIAEMFELEIGGKRHNFMIRSEALRDGGIARIFDCLEITPIVQAQRAAEAASKSKSNFLATMSHEIRTPMNAIIGIAQIQLQRGDLPDDYATALRKIYSSANNQLGIINDILDMSKIETGKMELNPIEYDIPNLINDAMQLNVVRIGEKLIEFIVDVDENLPSRLYGDELRIKQILNNLLSNAIKYTDEGCVKLSVGYLTDSDGVTLRFVVEDTGQGMKPQDKERLFSEYQRFNAEANRATEGTGLGLNITKKLVDMMGGTIGVESEYGKGSVFTVTVRQKAVVCPAIGASVVEQLRKFTFTGDRRVANQRIDREIMPYGSVLVVDDVATNLYVADGLLSLYQLKIDTADSGFEAIEKVENGGVYDIIFMDHMMPRMDGIETMQKLRELGYTGTIVALTANALVGNDEMFKQKGFDGFVSKPIDIHQLDKALHKFIRDKHPEEAKKYAEEADGSGDCRHQGSDVKSHKSVNRAINPKLLKFFCQDAKEAIITLRKTVECGDAKLFTITAHAMKSALANVGEMEASGLAAALENVGRSGDIGYISANSDEFIRTLESLVDKFSRIVECAAVSDKNDIDDSGVAEDKDYLLEQLRRIKSACDNYDDDAVYAALDRLRERRWKPSTTESLEKIRESLYLSSDFGEAAQLSASLFDILMLDKVFSDTSKG